MSLAVDFSLIFNLVFPMRKRVTVDKKRPVNLDLATLKFPPMAIASILHRLSGVALFLLFPCVLYLFGLSLEAEAGYHRTLAIVASPYAQVALWAFFAALMYHFFAGIRHIIMDLGFGETRTAGYRSAVLVIILGVASTIFLGIWLW